MSGLRENDAGLGQVRASESRSIPSGRSRSFTRWIELCVTLAVPLLLFVVFVRSPTSGLLDAKYAALTSEAILEGDGFDLSRFLRQYRLEEASPEDPAAPLPWQLERVRGRLLYVFPPGTPVLSLPLFAVLRTLGMSALDEDGQYSARREIWMQLVAASILAALTAALILRLARHEVPLLQAAAIALLAGLGSSLWTLASRQLWSQTWSALLLGAGWLELALWEEGKTPRPLLLGAIASAAFWVRPSNAWIAIALTAFVALRHRPQIVRLMTAGACGLATYWAWALYYHGALFPSYVVMSRPWAARSFLRELPESLISTHHGLLVYSPVLLAAAYVLLRHGVPSPRRPLALLGSVLVLGHLCLHAASGAAWGPDVPRFQHDLVPILAWFGALALRRHHELGARAEAFRWSLRLASALMVLALAAASILASIGSVYVGQQRMGSYRASLEAQYSRWDLRRSPQYLGLRALGVGDPLPAKQKHKNRARTAR
jgi:hypothetical protein